MARPAHGQDTLSAQATYADPAARQLIERARQARDRDIQGISSYEGLLRERIYVGLTALNFRRERGLFEQERVARLRWSSDGERVIQWLAARQAIPIVGADTRRDEILAEGRMRGAGAEVQRELRTELPEELLDGSDLPGFAFDPGGDRLAFGEEWALHPLADSAETGYRYASGDTLTLGLPDGRSVTLYEVKVEPRRADFHLVAGSLWFDAASTALVRATYRPARAFNLDLDEPEEGGDVPGLLKPIEAEITYVTVEYSLYEFRFWLPRRFALEGVARLGRFMRIPLTVEWNVRDYSVNDAETEIPLVGPLPPGWSRREQRVEDDETGEVSYVTTIVPETTELLTSAELSEGFGDRTPTAFTDDEIEELRGELEELLPTYQRFRPRLAWGLERNLVRYNRVEGISVGGSLTVPVTPSTEMDVEARIGTGDGEPNGTIALKRGSERSRWSLSGFHRLASMGDWEDPFSLPTSAGNLVFGSDRGEYYRMSGASLLYARSGPRVRWSAEGFFQRQRPVGLGTEFFLLEPFRDDTARTVLQADRADVYGARTNLSWFAGVDPNGLILTGTLLAEAGEGDRSYQRAASSVSASHPLPFGLAGALELGAGAVWGDAPVQSNYFLGGSKTLRGFDVNSFHGTAFWRARGEIATGFAGARIGLFSDAAWVGERSDFALDDPSVSVGVGTSLLDGLFRVDLARAVRRAAQWKLHFYLDGLF